jgi:hypothetical protein
MSEETMRLAERVRRALLDEAAAAWEEASLAGLCGEGAWEAAVGRMRGLDLASLVAGDPAAAPVSSEDEPAP